MPPDTADIDPATTAETLYGPSYYASHCGPVPYARTPHWLEFFGQVASELVRSFAPRRVFDAGCALGLLVECLWDRGVESYGRDISHWAIEQVRMDVRRFCKAGSIADPIDGEYDLVTCIEVLEHMPEDEALRAIAAMASAAPRILFSSSPTDLDEPTHCNVRPTIYWLARWAEVGFAPVPLYDAGYLAAHAFVLERSEAGRTGAELAAFADLIRCRMEIRQLAVRRAFLEAEIKSVAQAREAEIRSAAQARTDSEASLAEINTRADAAVATADKARQACDAARQSATEAEQRATAAEAAMAATREQGRVHLDDTIARLRTETDERLAQQAAESQRTRSILVRQAGEIRAEVASQRERAEALDAELVTTRADTAAARSAASEALAASEFHRSQVAIATREAASLHDEFHSIRNAWLRASAERDRLLGSASWRMMWPLRAGAELFPRRARRFVRKSLTLGWWTLTGQLPSRLRLRRQIVRDTRVVAAEPLFDPVWYAARNPEVEASGLDPALHYVTIGGLLGRDPGPAFSASRYCALNPDEAGTQRPALLRSLAQGHPPGWTMPAASPPLPDAPPPLPLAEPAQENAVPVPPVPTVQPAEAPVAALPTLRDRFFEHYDVVKPPLLVTLPHAGRRLNLVIDSINSGSLYGGAATSLILAALLARKLDATLRIITRREPAVGSNVSRLFATHGIKWNGNIDFLHVPVLNPARALAMDAGDMFLTTSWWTTQLIRNIVKPERIIYLLQEDERMFYSRGDDRLYAEQTMSDPGIQVVINSELLHYHLTRGNDPIPGLGIGTAWFEPAFPSAYCDFDAAAARAESGRRNLMFYARPSNLRNLYYHGTQMLSAAVEQGMLDPDAWDITFVGRDLHQVCISQDHPVRTLENLSWDQYSSLVATMDLGIALIETPHPSYPPLDLAASGAVALTNRCLNKQSLDGYSSNIICADTDIASLTQGFAKAIELACNLERRRENFSGNRLHRDWMQSLGPVVDRLHSAF